MRTLFGRPLLRLLPAVLLFTAAVASPVRADWQFAWQRDPVTGDYACSAFSGGLPLWPGHGDRETTVSLGVQAEGRIIVQSDPVRFAGRTPGTVTVSVDGQPAFAGAGGDGRTVTFSEEDSVELHRQFETGRSVRVGMVFVGGGQQTFLTIPLEGYPRAAAQYKGCRGLLLNSEGWTGVHVARAPEDPGWLRWLRDSTSRRGPGVVVMTVDPRKEAYRSDLRPGDVIVGCNGAEADVPSFIGALKGLEPGKAVVLDVVRDHQLLNKSITRPKGGARRASGREHPAP
jgi:hypothetical protein